MLLQLFIWAIMYLDGATRSCIEGSSFPHFPVPLSITFFSFYVCVHVGEQGSCLVHLDLNTALKLHSCERPAALPGYPNTMCSICKPLHKARTVFQLLFSLCENQPAGFSYPRLMPLRSKRKKKTWTKSKGYILRKFMRNWPTGSSFFPSNTQI